MKTTILALALILALASGCRKCYTCYVTGGKFNCHKQNDTILVKASTGIRIRYTLAFYRNSGYACDTLLFGYDIGAYNNRKCPDGVVERATANLDSCIED